MAAHSPASAMRRAGGRRREPLILEDELDRDHRVHQGRQKIAISTREPARAEQAHHPHAPLPHLPVDVTTSAGRPARQICAESAACTSSGSSTESSVLMICMSSKESVEVVQHLRLAEIREAAPLSPLTMTGRRGFRGATAYLLRLVAEPGRWHVALGAVGTWRRSASLGVSARHALAERPPAPSPPRSGPPPDQLAAAGWRATIRQPRPALAAGARRAHPSVSWCSTARDGSPTAFGGQSPT